MSNAKELDTKKLNAMKAKILLAEKQNLNTREKNTDQMIEKIRMIIRDEANKTY